MKRYTIPITSRECPKISDVCFSIHDKPMLLVVEEYGGMGPHLTVHPILDWQGGLLNHVLILIKVATAPLCQNFDQ